MGKLTIGVADMDVRCSECGHDIRAGRFGVNWDEVFLCSQPCVDAYVEKNVGKDFIAAQDQALANATEALSQRPNNFILIYEDGTDVIGSVVLAHPEFIATTIPLIIDLSQNQGTIEPPNGGTIEPPNGDSE